MTTVRLDVQTEIKLQRLAVRRGQTKSDVIRDAIDRLVAEAEDAKQLTAYERLRPFAGVADSGGKQLSRDTGRRFRELLEGKRARRTG